jgi:hypothetical protein
MTGGREGELSIVNPTIHRTSFHGLRIVKNFGDNGGIKCTTYVTIMENALKQCRISYFPVTRGGTLSLLSALHVRSTVTHCLDSIAPWQKSPQKVKVLD